MSPKNFPAFKLPPLPPALGSVRRLVGVVVLVAALALVGITVSEYRLLYGIASLPEGQHATATAFDCPQLCPDGESASQSATATATAESDTRAPAILNLRGFRHTIPFTPD